MKIITCPACRQNIRIPDDRHIRFNCPNKACSNKFEYVNGEPVKPKQRSLVIPVLALLTAAVGSFFGYLFPVPLVCGLTWFLWWYFKRAEKIWAKAVSGICLSTAIGSSLLFVLQLVLNLINDSTLEIPTWLLRLDDFLIWSRTNLKYLSEISLLIYVLILAALIIIAWRKPGWKPVSKFIASEEWIGKITAILIVITSFTFFSPDALEKTADEAYYKHYKVIYREKLKQERRKLIAEAFKKEIEGNDSNDYAANISVLNEEVKSIEVQETAVLDEAGNDAASVMKFEQIPLPKDAGYYYTSGNWSGSDDNIRLSWERASTSWLATDVKESKAPAGKPAPDIAKPPTTRSAFTKTKIAEVKQATIVADEVVVSLKAVCSKLFGSLIPGGENLVGTYIEALVNAASEYLFEITDVPGLMKEFFDHVRSKGKLDLFARIGSFWNNIAIVKQQKLDAEREVQLEKERAIQAEKDVVLQKQREAEDAKELAKERALEEENESLAEKIKKRIDGLKVDMPDKWRETKMLLERKQARVISDEEMKTLIKEKAVDDVSQLLITENLILSAGTRNTSLRQNLSIVNKSSSITEVLKNFGSACSRVFGICPRCHMPAIPGTPCIARF